MYTSGDHLNYTDFMQQLPSREKKPISVYFPSIDSFTMQTSRLFNVLSLYMWFSCMMAFSFSTQLASQRTNDDASAEFVIELCINCEWKQNGHIRHSCDVYIIITDNNNNNNKCLLFTKLLVVYMRQLKSYKLIYQSNYNSRFQVVSFNCKILRAA